MNSSNHIMDHMIMLGMIWEAQSHMETFQIGISNDLHAVLYDFLAFFTDPTRLKLQFYHLTSCSVYEAQRKLFNIHPWCQMKGNRCGKYLKLQN